MIRFFIKLFGFASDFQFVGAFFNSAPHRKGYARADRSCRELTDLKKADGENSGAESATHYCGAVGDLTSPRTMQGCSSDCIPVILSIVVLEWSVSLLVTVRFAEDAFLVEEVPGFSDFEAALRFGVQSRGGIGI